MFKGELLNEAFSLSFDDRGFCSRCQSSIAKRYTKEELKQLTADLLAPYEQRGYTKEKSFTGTKAQYAKWEKDPTSPTAKYADQAISVEQAKGTGDQFVYFCPAEHVAWAVIFTADK